MVYVIAGDSRGQQGKVLSVDAAKNRAIVHISNLQPIDPKSGKPTRVGRKANDNGKLVRYAKKSGEEIK